MPARILVIDDEPDVLDVVCHILELEGFDAVCIDHPGAIDRALTDRRPDLFLADVMLPTTNGIDVAKELRQRIYHGTPMLAMSASQLMNGLGAPATPDLTLTVSPFSCAVVAIGHDDLMSSPV